MNETNMILCWIASGLFLIASEINEKDLRFPNWWSYKIPAMGFMVYSISLSLGIA